MKSFLYLGRVVPVVLVAVTMLVAGCGEQPEQAQYWSYQIANQPGGAVLETDSFDLVLEGVEVTEGQAGQFQIGGPGTSSGTIPVGPDLAFQHQYADGTLTMTLGDQVLRVTDGGTVLAVNGNTYTLDDEPTLVVRADGTIAYRGG